MKQMLLSILRYLFLKAILYCLKLLSLSFHTLNKLTNQVFHNDSEELQEKVNRLETKNIKMQEEFNVQRAKMKELFLQKEGETAHH